MEYVYTYHPLNSIMQPINGVVALRRGIEIEKDIGVPI